MITAILGWTFVSLWTLIGMLNLGSVANGKPPSRKVDPRVALGLHQLAIAAIVVMALVL